jgi:hypothetical protein
MLHVKFKHTFISEPDADFRKLWITNRMVFDTSDEFEVSKIRYAMMAFTSLRRRSGSKSTRRSDQRKTRQLAV